jgi:hypothetical protein
VVDEPWLITPFAAPATQQLLTEPRCHRGHLHLALALRGPAAVLLSEPVLIAIPSMFGELHVAAGLPPCLASVSS